jgi:hypothetical protein
MNCFIPSPFLWIQSSQFQYRLKVYLTISLLTLALSCFSYACLDSVVSCTSDGACDPGLVCVKTQCVDENVEGESYTIYTQEMHLRLVSQCGICHGIKGKGPSLPTPEEEEEQIRIMQAEMQMDTIMLEETQDIQDPCAPFTDPLEIPKLPVILGDSGWRIYLDDLNEERLKASYQDTMQYINIDDPENSLLFAYGRGEIYITEDRLHPRVYPKKLIPTAEDMMNDMMMGEMNPSDECIEEPSVDPTMNLESEDVMNGGMEALQNREGDQDMEVKPTLSKAQVIYQRLVNWSALQHKYFAGTGQFNIQVYQTNVMEVIDRVCGGCHRMPAPQIYASFEYEVKAMSSAGIASLAPLINPKNPSQSALIRMAFGGYEHQKLLSPTTDENLKYSESILTWIELLK